MPIKLNSALGGSVSIDVPATTSTYTLTAPAKTGTIITSADANTVTQAMVQTGFAGNGPSFYAYAGSSATALVAGNAVKITLDSELWDTNSNFANSRFTPTVAGYYFINAGVRADIASNAVLHCQLHKNGTAHTQGNFINSTSGQVMSIVSGLIYLNGSTDYVELLTYSASSGNAYTGSSLVFMSGFLARSA